MDFKNATLPKFLPLEKSKGQSRDVVEMELLELLIAIFNYKKSSSTIDSRGITCDSTKVTCDSTEITCDSSCNITCDSTKITCDSTTITCDQTKKAVSENENTTTQSLAELVFDANVLGVPHLGSMNLIRRAINNDGLVLLPNNNEELATRYVYKAWRARNHQGRGLHFLRLFLRLFLSNNAKVEQMAQHKDYPYPTMLMPESEVENDENYFLSSRVQISIDAENLNWQQLIRISATLWSIIPARIVPTFKLINKPQLVKAYHGVALQSSNSITVYPKNI